MPPRAFIEPATLAEIASPALIFFNERIEANMAAMLALVGGDPSRLRPHVKTHKCGAIIRRWNALGVGKHKCATVREAEVLATFGATDIMLAFPCVGPSARALARLAARWPSVRFSSIGADPVILSDLSAAAAAAGCKIGVFIEMDVGHGRTGTTDLAVAIALGRQVASDPNLELRGLHGYDGHLGSVSAEERQGKASEVRQKLAGWKEAFHSAGLNVEALVLAGSPSFPHHAKGLQPGMELSAGTVVLHDTGYGKHAELADFVPAVAILTRVIDHPGANRVTFDCGSKAIACDQPAGSRLTLQGLEGAKSVIHNEEHLVVECADVNRWPIGTATLAWPSHACPTCAWHDEAIVVNGAGRVEAVWPIEARGRGPRLDPALAPAGVSSRLS